MSDETIGADLSREFVQSGLELLVESPGAPTWRFPVVQTEFSVGGAGCDLQLSGLGPRQGSFRLVDGQLSYTNLDEAVPALLGSEPTRYRLLHAGDELRLGEHRLRLCGGELGSLEGLSGEFRGRVWTLGAETVCLGRPGRRENRISLDHPTISREHAVLEGSLLRAETARPSTWVNGEPLAGGATRELADGDLLRLGELLFRFRRHGESAPVLQLYSLGPFEAHLRGERLAETAWRTHNARYLLARLAADGGRAVPVEVILDEFWPELPPDRGRKNLNWVVSILRQLLRPVGADEWLVRTTQSIQLETGAGGWHDLHELDRRLARRTPADLRQALELGRGPYLDGFYADWALRTRDRVDRELLEAGLWLVEHYHGQGDWRSCLECAHKVLGWDPCSQEAALRAVQAYRELGRPAEAVRLYESCVQRLTEELGVEPSDELRRARELC